MKVYPIYPMFQINEPITPMEYLYSIWSEYPILTNMPEVWRIIPEWIAGHRSTNYWISTYGRLYNIHTRKLARTFVNNAGYEVININNHPYLIHRLVMLVFAPIPNFKEFQVNHRDEVKTHNWIWNLEWMSNIENIRYSIESGYTKVSGEDHYNCTITEEQADRIGYLIANSNMTYEEIANDIGCSTSVVANLAFGNSWINIYNKYGLENILRNRRITTVENTHAICQYIRDNKHKIKRGKRIDFYKEIANIYGLDSNNPGDIRFIEDLYYKKRAKDICNLYY